LERDDHTGIRVFPQSQTFFQDRIFPGIPVREWRHDGGSEAMKAVTPDVFLVCSGPVRNAGSNPVTLFDTTFPNDAEGHPD
jgi:hypothetical protein